MIDSISAVIITKDAAVTLTDTLNSLKSFQEVIILDNGSQDNTETIARQYKNVSFHIDTFDGFGLTKNKAVHLSKNDWVLSLDADESVSDELLASIQQWKIAIYYGGWGNDKLVRLFNRKRFLFNDNCVHESVVVSHDGKQIPLNGVLKHNAVQEMGQFLSKVNRYSELRHKDLLEKNKVPSLLMILLKVKFAFFRSYILQAGILEGWRGLVIAYSNANGVFFKYMKAYAAKRCR
jgi:glycosyltransferase involved in cell wall biosynthesis